MAEAPPASDVDLETADPSVPVRLLPGETVNKDLRDEIALCLSGGGYRAMLFHCGAVLRLNDAGVLGRLNRVSSVSGGSVTAGVLGMKWRELGFRDGTSDRLMDLVIKPIRAMADRTIDLKAGLAIVTPGTISDYVEAAYKKHLFGNKTLQDLPADNEGPRFIFNATNVQTGSLFRFSRPYMADYQVGRWNNPAVALAKAVAASSAFPPFLSPCFLEIDAPPNEPGSNAETSRPPFTTHAVLSDGGVYDNLGLETAFKRCRTVLVSDGGMKTGSEKEPAEDWARHAKRVLDLIDNQVRSLRKRALIDAYNAPADSPARRGGAYWGIATDLRKYNAGDPFGYFRENNNPWTFWKDPPALAAIPTRLAQMDWWKQEALIDWGYVVCDAALRAHAAKDLKDRHGIDVKPARGLPYPNPK